MTGLAVYNYISALSKFKYNGHEYYSMQDLMQNKQYSKGCNASQIKLIQRKKFNTELDILQGRVGIDDITIFKDTVISKKHTKRFVKCDAVMEEFRYIWDTAMQNNDNNEQIGRWKVFDAKPLVKPMDNDFYMFKDKDGKQYSVEMRGERSRDKILFNCKEVGEMFEMNRLYDNILETHTAYKEMEDFIFCRNTHPVGGNTDKTLYLTYNGLKKVINNSRSGRAKEFADWLDDIIFAVIAGDDEQRMEASADVMNLELQALKKIMNKCASTISCLYLLKTDIQENDKTVYKFGYTDNLIRRFKQHVKDFGESLEIYKYTFISEGNLSSAEKYFKDNVSCFNKKLEGNYTEKLKSQTELLFLDSKEIGNVKIILENVGDKFGSDDKIQRNILTDEIKELKQALALKDKDIELKNKDIENERMIHKLELESKDKDIELKNKEIELKNKEIESRDKDLEILNLKLLLNQKNN